MEMGMEMGGFDLISLGVSRGGRACFVAFVPDFEFDFFLKYYTG